MSGSAAAGRVSTRASNGPSGSLDLADVARALRGELRVSWMLDGKSDSTSFSRGAAEWIVCFVEPLRALRIA